MFMQVSIFIHATNEVEFKTELLNIIMMFALNILYIYLLRAF